MVIRKPRSIKRKIGKHADFDKIPPAPSQKAQPEEPKVKVVYIERVSHVNRNSPSQKVGYRQMLAFLMGYGLAAVQLASFFENKYIAVLAMAIGGLIAGTAFLMDYKTRAR